MKKHEQILVQTGISLVSIDQAHLNLETEMDPFEWNFDKLVQAGERVLEMGTEPNLKWGLL